MHIMLGKVADVMGYERLMAKQEEAIVEFMSGKDVFVSFSLCHMYTQVGLLQHSVSVVYDVDMEQDNFEKLMVEIQKPKTNMEKYLAATIAEAQSLHHTGEDIARYFTMYSLLFAPNSRRRVMNISICSTRS